MRIGRRLSLFALALLLLVLFSPAVRAEDGDSVLGSNLGATLACLAIGGLAYVGCGAYGVYFVYNDALARSGNGVLWLILGLINWPIALLVWMIIRPEKRL